MARKDQVVAGKPAARTVSPSAGAKPVKMAYAKVTGQTSAARGALTPKPTVRGSSKAAPVKGRIAVPPAKLTTVTLKQLAAGLSESRGLPKRDAESFAAELIGDLVKHVKTGAKVRITGLGVIEIKDRPARTARNPGTGETVSVQASRKVVFRVAKDLKEAV